MKIQVFPSMNLKISMCFYYLLSLNYLTNWLKNLRMLGWNGTINIHEARGGCGMRVLMNSIKKMQSPCVWSFSERKELFNPVACSIGFSPLLAFLY